MEGSGESADLKVEVVAPVLELGSLEWLDVEVGSFDGLLVVPSLGDLLLVVQMRLPPLVDHRHSEQLQRLVVVLQTGISFKKIWAGKVRKANQYKSIKSGRRGRRKPFKHSSFPYSHSSLNLATTRTRLSFKYCTLRWARD